jgi:tetratricopeptide (TPR) repeat protein
MTDPSAVLDSGRSLYALGRYEEALSLFMYALSLLPPTRSPVGDEAAFWIILTRIARGDGVATLDAIEEYRTTRKDSAFLPDLLYQRGRIQLLSGQFAAAKETFRWFLAERLPNHPLQPSALFWYGECLSALGEYSAALEAFRMLVRDYPSSPKRETARQRIASIEAGLTSSQPSTAGTGIASGTGTGTASPSDRIDRDAITDLRTEALALLQAWLARLAELPR